LYLVVSRVTSKRGLRILVEDDNGDCTNKTQNIVYSEVFLAMPSA
jgi:ATP-dependent DNA helicase PIF1